MLTLRSLVVATIAGLGLFGESDQSSICRAADAAAPSVSTPSASPAQPAPATQASPFDQDDPELAELRKLDWKSIDFDNLDARTRCTVYFAMNRGLQNLGTKADARLELLVDYLDEKEMGTEYAINKALEEEFKPVPFDDLRKVAAAYLRTSAGAAKFGKEFASTTDELLPRYLSLYEKTSRREYDEGCESRLQVRSMALFLERKGKLEEFKQWAVAERQRRQEEFQKELAEKQAAQQQEAKEARERAVVAAEQRRQQLAEERAAAQAERAMQQPVAGQSGGYDSDNWWGTDWGYGTGYYYYGNAYRGHVRDKAQGARERWRTGRPAQLPSRGFGGGGGRRR